MGCLYDKERAEENGTVINPLISESYLEQMAYGITTAEFKDSYYTTLNKTGWLTDITSTDTSSMVTNGLNETTGKKTVTSSLGWTLYPTVSIQLNEVSVEMESGQTDEDGNISPVNIDLIVNDEVVGSAEIGEFGRHYFDIYDKNITINGGESAEIELSNAYVSFTGILSEYILYKGGCGVYFKRGSKSSNTSVPRVKMWFRFSIIDTDSMLRWTLYKSDELWEGYPYMWIPYEGKNSGSGCNIYVGQADGTLKPCRLYIGQADGTLMEYQVVLK